MTLFASGPSSPHPAEAWLAIWGMYCPKCQARVNDALHRLPGVLEVEVDWVYMGARVVIAPGEVGVDDLIACVGEVDTSAGYRLWAASGPEVSSALRKTWELRSLRSHSNIPLSSSITFGREVDLRPQPSEPRSAAEGK